MASLIKYGNGNGMFGSLTDHRMISKQHTRKRNGGIYREAHRKQQNKQRTLSLPLLLILLLLPLASARTTRPRSLPSHAKLLHLRHRVLERVLRHPAARHGRAVDRQDLADLPASRSGRWRERFLGRRETAHAEAEGGFFCCGVCLEVACDEDVEVVFYASPSVSAYQQYSHPSIQRAYYS